MQVYDFAITPNGAGVPLQGANGASVIFRFMPDAREVQSALEVRTCTARPIVAGCCGAAAPACLEPSALLRERLPAQAWAESIHQRNLSVLGGCCQHGSSDGHGGVFRALSMYGSELVRVYVLQGRCGYFAPMTGAVLGAQLYQDAGIVADEFVGVPVFQAEGLTVKTERARYMPLFLARADLDAAVGNAYSRRGGEREASASAEVAAAAEADQKAQAAVRSNRHFTPQPGRENSIVRHLQLTASSTAAACAL